MKDIDSLARHYGASGYYYDGNGFVGFQHGNMIHWYRWMLPGESSSPGAGYKKTGETFTAKGATFRRAV